MEQFASWLAEQYRLSPEEASGLAQRILAGKEPDMEPTRRAFISEKTHQSARTMNGTTALLNDYQAAVKKLETQGPGSLSEREQWAYDRVQATYRAKVAERAKQVPQSNREDMMNGISSGIAGVRDGLKEALPRIRTGIEYAGTINPQGQTKFEISPDRRSLVPKSAPMAAQAELRTREAIMAEQRARNAQVEVTDVESIDRSAYDELVRQWRQAERLRKGGGGANSSRAERGFRR